MSFGQLRRVELRRPAESVEDGRTVAVEALHFREVLRRLRLVGQHLAHELLLRRGAEGPVEELLVAHGALRHRAQPLAARRPGAVAGPDLQVVGQRAELFQALPECARRAVRRARHPGRLLEEVGPAHVAHEDEVAGDDAHRRGGAGGVGHHEGEVLGRVPGVCSTSNRMLPTMNCAPSLRSTAPALLREGVLPAGPALVGEVHHRAGQVRELPRAGEEVGVDVGLRHVRDAELLRLGGADVLRGVAVRVHHHRLAGGGARR